MKTKDITLTALFSVVLFISSFFKLPIGPVPVTTQTFFVLIIGLVLSPKLAFLATFINLMLQSIFSNAHASVTFGFIIGFIVAATVTSLIVQQKSSFLLSLMAVIIATLAIYACGTVYFNMMLPNKTFSEVIAITMLPFLIGDTLKAIFAIFIAQRLKKFL